MNTAAYLDRIGYRGGIAPTAETLRRLHSAHLLTVPFENLSIHYREPIVLEDQALRAKQGGTNYWEGAVDYSGTHKGVGYLEMTGYEGQVHF